MTNPDVRRLFKALGGKDQIRFVGGCVRNHLLGLPVEDIDLATIHAPDFVIKRLKAEGIKFVPTGVMHGTITAVINAKGYEITTLRQDIETDGRHAKTAFTNNWTEDAARRDFTINTLYADLDGTIYDPLGIGLKDLERRKVRFVGCAETRIQEDYLRILRFFRFTSIYGKGKIDKKALVASVKFAPQISTLSRERITQEFSKILLGKTPVRALKIIHDNKILPNILGKNFEPNRIGSVIKLQNIIGEVAEDVIFSTRIFICFGFSFNEVGNFSNHLILNKKQISILKDIPKIKIDTKRLDTLKIMNLLYHFSENSVLSAIIIGAVKGDVSSHDIKKIWKNLENTKRPVFMISGKDMLNKGLEEGENIGKELHELEKKWIGSGFTLTRKELLKI